MSIHSPMCEPPRLPRRIKYPEPQRGRGGDLLPNGGSSSLKGPSRIGHPQGATLQTGPAPYHPSPQCVHGRYLSTSSQYCIYCDYHNCAEVCNVIEARGLLQLLHAQVKRVRWGSLKGATVRNHINWSRIPPKL